VIWIRGPASAITALRSLRHDDHGVWTGRAGNLYLRWVRRGTAGTGRRAGRGALLRMSLTVPPGQSADLVLEYRAARCPPQPPDATGLWHPPRGVGSRGAVARGEHRTRDSRQAFAVMPRGLTSSSGGMVAAATSSLPERARAGRNYDYRYAWIRDQCYAGQAAAIAGTLPLLDDAVRFVSLRLHADGAKLSPAYTVDGGQVPDQRQLELPGYPGGFDLVGNWGEQAVSAGCPG